MIFVLSEVRSLGTCTFLFYFWEVIVTRNRTVSQQLLPGGWAMGKKNSIIKFILSIIKYVTTAWKRKFHFKYIWRSDEYTQTFRYYIVIIFSSPWKAYSSVTLKKNKLIYTRKIGKTKRYSFYFNRRFFLLLTLLAWSEEWLNHKKEMWCLLVHLILVFKLRILLISILTLCNKSVTFRTWRTTN